MLTVEIVQTLQSCRMGKLLMIRSTDQLKEELGRSLGGVLPLSQQVVDVGVSDPNLVTSRNSQESCSSR